MFVALRRADEPALAGEGADGDTAVSCRSMNFQFFMI